jgi:hypothetical protein
MLLCFDKVGAEVQLCITGGYCEVAGFVKHY